MRIDGGCDLTEDERLEACSWLEYSVGRSRNEISAWFTVEREMPGSVRLTFDGFLLDADGKTHCVNGDIVKEPFTIFASDRLGWLQRYLERTGTVIT